MFRIVLFEPEIPPNTGNVIRLCANTGAELHLIKPLGFELDRRSVRRAGLDYRWMAAVHVHANLAACIDALRTAVAAKWWVIETGGTRRYDAVAYRPGDVLLFGSERQGVPPRASALLRDTATPATWLSIPMLEGNRSLNLANAVSVVTYEAWRQNGFAAADPAARLPASS